MPPTVSVCIPAWNAAPWLRRAVDSALAQTVPPLEILVVDDGSTDDTPRILESYGDRIRWIRTENRGQNETRNRLIEETRGEWIQFLDADDHLDRDKIEGQLRIGEEGDAAVVVAPVRMEPGDRVLHRSRHEDPWLDLVEAGLGITSSNLWSRRAVLDAGGWDPERETCCEYYLVFRILQRGGRVARDSRVRATWGWNPDGITRSDPGRLDHQFAGFVRRVAAFLEERGDPTEGRRNACGFALLKRTFDLWKRGHRGWRDAERWTREVRPRPWEWGDPSWRVYAAVYRLLGFAAARRYDALAATLRRAPR